MRAGAESGLGAGGKWRAKGAHGLSVVARHDRPPFGMVVGPNVATVLMASTQCRCNGKVRYATPLVDRPCR